VPRYTPGVDEPSADIVSFAELSREAMFHRLDRLARDWSEEGVRSVDDELAALVYDSDLAPEPLLAVRSAGSPTRQLTFRSPDLFIEVQLERAGRELTCQVVPSQPVRLELRHKAGVLDLGADGIGVFHVPDLPSGGISLRCVPIGGDARPAATGWISVSDRP
jgi:hypothetical protein